MPVDCGRLRLDRRRARSADRRACCAGPAIPKAARRSSRPIRRIPIGSSASTSRSPALLAAGARPHAASSSTSPSRRSTRAIARGDADIGLSGIEDTPARRATLAVTIPYYEFREVLSVRDADAGALAARSATCAARRSARSAARSPTRSCCAPSASTASSVVSYEDDVHPYSDLVIGRVDAVLLDNVLAERRHEAMPGFTIQPQTVAIGHYVGVLAAAERAAARRASTRSCAAAMRDGTLERILRKWSVWNDDQPKLYAQLLAGEPVPAIDRPRHVDQRGDRSARWEAAPALSAVAAARVGRHDRAVVPVDGAGGRARRADRHRPRLRRPLARARC